MKCYLRIGLHWKEQKTELQNYLLVKTFSAFRTIFAYYGQYWVLQNWHWIGSSTGKFIYGAKKKNLSYSMEKYLRGYLCWTSLGQSLTRPGRATDLGLV